MFRWFLFVSCPVFASAAAFASETALYAVDFARTPAGAVPAGWGDLGVEHSCANWGVDGRGFLRMLWKGAPGIIAYKGWLADGKKAAEFRDGVLRMQFKKTPDAGVKVGLAGRLQDAGNFYALRFSGDDHVELVKAVKGEEAILAEWVTRRRYSEGEIWELSLLFDGDRITGRVGDGKGQEVARVDALEKNGFASGRPGILAGNFAAVKSFSMAAVAPFPQVLTEDQIAGKNAAEFPGAPDRVLKPAENIPALDTPFDKIAEAYDVVVAGAGTGGWAAAIQASRMGARVLLLEEADWIGGQMSAAAVTSMDEEGLWEKFPVRQRGIYREFHESIVNYYYTRDKDPFRAYYAWPEQLEGGYEPKVTRQLLYAFIADARSKGVLDLVTRAKVVEAVKAGDAVTGVVIEHDGKRRTVRSKVLVEATEYGDVLPLAGARYRVGNSRSDALDPAGLVQAHTWVGVIREYPDGVPDHLRIKTPPPGYDSRKYKGSQLWGPVIWGSAGKGVKGPRNYRVLFAWRGMADTDSPMTGASTEERHTQCGLNGGRQDYPVTVASIEEPAARRQGERDGIYRTLGEIYYFQNELGLPWSVAEDEGYGTEWQKESMKKLELRPDLEPIAIHLPQWPYVREARRGMGLYTLRAADLGRFENARHFETSVAMGDYFMDLDHGDTGHAVEADLDTGEPPRGGGPFQVPFEVFIPEKVDGLVFAEKNISQSRLVNGATRLQPITMLDGQAAGAIAATAALKGIAPRQVNPVAVQSALLSAGSNLIQRWYEDVPWGTPLWRATQLLSLYRVIDPPGPFVKDGDKSMGGGQFWRPGDPLGQDDAAAALGRLSELAGRDRPEAADFSTWEGVGKAMTSLDPQWRSRAEGLAVPKTGPVTRGDFAQAAAGVLSAVAKPALLSDASAQ